MSDDLNARRALRTAKVTAPVAQPAAVTSVVAAGTAPTKAEYDALRQDLINTRAALAALITASKAAGQIG